VKARTTTPGGLGWVAAAFGLGTLVMYFADPDRGALRRGLARDQALAGMRRARDQVRRTMEDARNRAAGTVSSVAGRWRGGPVSDTVLGERVRARLGLVCTCPDAIDVEAQNGTVVVRGAVPRDEIGQIVRAVKWTPGVRMVDDQLEPRGAGSATPTASGM
jgi:osmotically-inducible protein OsmY